MKKIIFILLIIIIGCTKEETTTNPLSNTFWKNGPNLVEISDDTLYEYIDSLDLIFVSTYKVNKQTINIKGQYINDWGNKISYDTNYSCKFYIINDSLIFNNTYKGKKY